MGITTKKDESGQVSRKHFLRTSATAGLGAALAGNVLSGGLLDGLPRSAPAPGRPPADDLRVAVIGCGA